MIRLNNIIKTYEAGENQYTILKDISLHIQKGEYVALVGKSGSGKSTLLNMLTGVDKVTNGEVIVNGTNIGNYNESEMAEWRGKNVGIVFQFFQLIPTLSVLENILLPMDLVNRVPNGEREKKALALLKRVGLEQHANKMPSQLSGGEQQRVAIARALANDVELLIADEPTGNLDTINAKIILDLFSSLNKEGKTIVMVTHERSRVPGITRQILIRDGQIIEDGQLASA